MRTAIMAASKRDSWSGAVAVCGGYIGQNESVLLVPRERGVRAGQGCGEVVENKSEKWRGRSVREWVMLTL
jgi:hypothetical protein